MLLKSIVQRSGLCSVGSTLESARAAEKGKKGKGAEWRNHQQRYSLSKYTIVENVTIISELLLIEQ
jgi:hypothetical protein